MEICLHDIGKQYDGEWIFKSVSLSFYDQFCYLITGINGSGKSSLLKVLSGYSLPSQGVISWKTNKNEVRADMVYQQVSICAPFVSLFDKHTVKEAVYFHFNFKKILSEIAIQEVLDFCYLQDSRNKKISQLSSGMKQRLKLALSFLSDTPFLFLDEPCANLDESAIKWYQASLKKYSKNRLVIICSNNKQEEHFMCDKTINLAHYKHT